MRVSIERISRAEFLQGILKINQKISMKITEGTFAGIYPTRVEDTDDKELTVAGPTYKGANVPWSVGMSALLELTGDNGIYEFDGKTTQVRQEPLYQIVLEIPPDQPVRHVQRRRFVRLEWRIPIEVELSTAPGESSEPQPKERLFSRNISGNGICLSYHKRLAKGEQVDMIVPLLPGRPPLPIIGEVVRADDPAEGPTKDRFDIGIQFIQIRLSDQDRIVRFVFDKQRERVRTT